MSIPDELEKLARLKETGALTDEEFSEAKKRIIKTDAAFQSEANRSSLPRDDDSIGRAANKYVDFEITMKVVGAIIAALLFLFFFLPMACTVQNKMDNFPGNSFPAPPR